MSSGNKHILLVFLHFLVIICLAVVVQHHVEQIPIKKNNLRVSTEAWWFDNQTLSGKECWSLIVFGEK